MDQEVNLSIKLGDLSLSSDISATFVINGPDQIVTGIKEFEDGIDIGDNNSSLGNVSLAVGNFLSVGSYNFFYKGIELDATNLSARVYLAARQPRFPYPFCVMKGDVGKFRLQQNTVDLNNWTTTQKYLHTALNSSLSNNLSSAFYCDDSFSWHRGDYNQLCIDLGENYWEDMNEVKSKIFEYLDDAFSPEIGLSAFNLESGLAPGDSITIVNNDKIKSHRCGTLREVTEHGCVLEVTLNAAMKNYLTGYGIVFPDFDFDDYAVIFSDKPTLSGPANTSTYSSINVGTENKCLRRCSATIGKQNTAEADFAIALGRKAQANHYCSFVWGPAVEYVKSPKDYTFTIGQKDRLSALIKPASGSRTIYVTNKYGENAELHKFVLSCAAEDTSLMSYLAQKLSSQKFSKLQVGSEVAATGASSIAVGAGNTKAQGWCSIAVGNNTNSLTSCCAAFGQNLSAVGYNSFVVGRDSKALSTYSIAFGTNACAEHDSSFVWNSTTKEYKSNGSKTFNLNPQDGLSGVFIGKDNFIQCVLSAVSQMDSDQLNTLKGILGLS